MTEGDRTNAFPRAARLRRASDFKRVHGAGVGARSGPLMVWGRPNQLGHCRLGLAVSRRAGSAVVRNRIKRKLRESFRLSRRALPAAYDLVVSVRRHEVLALGEYQAHLREAVRRLEQTWQKKQQKKEPPSPPGD